MRNWLYCGNWMNNTWKRPNTAHAAMPPGLCVKVSVSGARGLQTWCRFWRLSAQHPSPKPAILTSDTRPIRTCSRALLSTDPIKCGRQISRMYRWRKVLVISLPSWISTLAKCWAGVYPTHWMPIFVSKHCKLPSRTTVARRYSTPIKALNLPQKHGFVSWKTTVFRSAWMAKAAIMIISLSNGYGVRSSMSSYTPEHSVTWRR